MPRCFMAKKLKYPYEQWKEQQEQDTEAKRPRSASPVALVKTETVDSQGKLCSMFACFFYF